MITEHIMWIMLYRQKKITDLSPYSLNIEAYPINGRVRVRRAKGQHIYKYKFSINLEHWCHPTFADGVAKLSSPNCEFLCFPVPSRNHGWPNAEITKLCIYKDTIFKYSVVGAEYGSRSERKVRRR